MGQYGNQPDFGTRAVAITPKGFAGGSYVGVTYQDGNGDPQIVYLTNSNLNISTLEDGTPIEQANDNDQWQQFVDNDIPCWAYYGYTKEDTLGLGKMYNGPACNQIQFPGAYNILPLNVADTMTTGYGYNQTLGQELKSIPTGYENQDTEGTNLWNYSQDVLPGTDIFNFTGLPGGLIDEGATPIKVNSIANFWTDAVGDRKFWYLDANKDAVKVSGSGGSYNGGYIRLRVDPTTNKYVAPQPLNSAALYVGTGGDLVVTIVGSETPVMFKNVPDASFLPIIVSNVWAWGDMGITTASDIVAIY